jgi:hypothetical protein
MMFLLILRDKGIDNKNLIQQSGIYKYNGVYYSIVGKLSHESTVYDKLVRKVNDIFSFSHRNMLEIYLLFVSDDVIGHEENEKTSVCIVDILRGATIQFQSQKRYAVTFTYGRKNGRVYLLLYNYCFG